MMFSIKKVFGAAIVSMACIAPCSAQLIPNGTFESATAPTLPPGFTSTNLAGTASWYVGDGVAPVGPPGVIAGTQDAVVQFSNPSGAAAASLGITIGGSLVSGQAYELNFDAVGTIANSSNFLLQATSPGSVGFYFASANANASSGVVNFTTSVQNFTFRFVSNGSTVGLTLRGIFNVFGAQPQATTADFIRVDNISLAAVVPEVHLSSAAVPLSMLFCFGLIFFDRRRAGVLSPSV